MMPLQGEEIVSRNPDGAQDGLRILGVRFDRLSRAEALRTMSTAFGCGEAWKVYIVNAHTLNLACTNPDYRSVLNAADLLLNDGSGVQFASRLAGRPFYDNLVGTDLSPQLCEIGLPKGVGVFLLGGRPGVAGRAAQTLRRRVPGLEISGSHHGYFSQEEDDRVVDLINRSGAGILLVAFGNPLQELWIHRNAPRLRCDICIGVGGFIDYLSGQTRRAPSWMRRMGIEWVYILWSQPHKWRRYVLGNPLFVARVLGAHLRGEP